MPQCLLLTPPKNALHTLSLQNLPKDASEFDVVIVPELTGKWDKIESMIQLMNLYDMIIWLDYLVDHSYTIINSEHCDFIQVITDKFWLVNTSPRIRQALIELSDFKGDRPEDAMKRLTTPGSALEEDTLYVGV